MPIELFHTCGVTVEGDALCWGANDARQLGTAIVNPAVPTPALVLGGLRFASVAAGGAGKSSLRAVRAHTCGLTPDGTAFCWGENGSGQLGNRTLTEHSGPVPVAERG